MQKIKMQVKLRVIIGRSRFL